MKYSKMLTAIAVAIASTTATFAQDKKPLELKYTSGSPPQGTPWAAQVNGLSKDYLEMTKGAVKIEPFFSSSLGSEQDTIQQVARGRIDMGGFSTGAASLLVPEIGLLTMPFYFKNLAEFDCVVDNHITSFTKVLFAKKGVVFLGWGEVGAVNIYGKKAYLKPADLAGVKATIIPNKTQSIFFSSVAANPNPMGLAEWVPSFQTGLSDVVMTVISFSLPSGMSKVAPFITRLELYNAPSPTLIHKGAFDKLTKEQQDQLSTYVASKTDTYRKGVRGFEEVLYGMHEKGGGTIVKASEEERNVWRKHMEPVFSKIVKETAGETDKFFALMEAGRKACTK